MKYAAIATAALLLSISAAAAGTDHPNFDKGNPPGFDEGNKTGWDEGNKEGWDNKRPPGLESKKDHDHDR